MRRGRIVTYIVLVLVVIAAVVGGYIWLKSQQKPPAAPVGTPTPEVRYVSIVTAGQNIAAGTLITEAMLNTIQIPETALVQGLFTDTGLVVNMFAKYAIQQGVPITDSMISASAGNVNLPGSLWASYIPQGYTAVSVPISRLSSAGYGIRDGDFVDVIVTMLLADIDPQTQSLLPNLLANLEPDATTGTVKITQGNVIQGHFEFDDVGNMVIYLQPSEAQRPRLVSQMIMQNIQVLHIGTFSLPGQAVPDQFTSSGTPTPTAMPVNEQQTTAAIVAPDMVTLMVTPQDAVTLTYLVFSGVKITLTLRNPNDHQAISQPDAASLEYLLTQYNIPVPAKLPYGLQPRLDALTEPVLGNDVAQ